MDLDGRIAVPHLGLLNGRGGSCPLHLREGRGRRRVVLVAPGRRRWPRQSSALSVRFRQCMPHRGWKCIGSVFQRDSPGLCCLPLGQSLLG